MTETHPLLLRFFEKEQYALSFLRGELRFGLLDRYRTIEGSRRDDKEGYVSFDWNVNAPQVSIDRKSGEVVARTESDRKIHYKGSSLNRYYILCTSHSEADIPVLSKKFGRFIVQIRDPLVLLERIKVVWRSHPLALIGCDAFITPAEYDKDGVLEPNPDLIAPFHYSYSQKPVSYADEKEFRYVLKCRTDVEWTWEEFLTLGLPDCRDLCSPNWEKASASFPVCERRPTSLQPPRSAHTLLTTPDSSFG